MSQPLNWVARVTGYFLARRRISVVLFLFLTTAGTLALLGLRREGFPQVPVKVVAISTVYKGAAAGEVEQSITNPLESAIKDLKEVKSVQSTSADNHSTVVVTLSETANVDTSVQDITSKISGVQLPKEADKPDVSVPTTGSAAWTIGLTGYLTPEQLLAQGHIFEREVAQIKGIKSVKLNSTFTDKVTITFDSAKLASSRVDVSKLQSTLQANNLNFPAGQDLTIDGARATAQISNRYSNLTDLANTPIPTITGGTVLLGDISVISRDIDQAGQINRVATQSGGRPVSQTGITYDVDVRSDADVLSVNQDLADTLSRLQSDGTLSRDLRVVRLFDDADSTQRQINEIMAGAIGEKWNGVGAWGYIGYVVGGIWLLMLAMFMFVNLRTAIIAGIAIPLSFLVTLLALYFAGYTLNTLTLFSMILVLGLVVDPAIVVLESIQRFKDMGRSGGEGVLAAVGSIGYGLFMATLCSIIVFIPFGLVSGIFGQIIKFIPITVIPALVASFFVPLIFLAPLAARFMKARRLAQPPQSEEAVLWRVSRWFKRANLFILGRAWLQIIIILLAIILPIGITAYLFMSGQVKSVQFSKPHDTLQAITSVSYPASFTDAQVTALANQTEQALHKHSEITSYYYAAQNSTGFQIMINLTPIGSRSVTADDLATQLRKELPWDASKQVYSTASTLSYGPPVNNFPVQIQIYDSNLAKLKTFALAVADHTRHIAGVTRVSDGYSDASSNSVQIVVDRSAAAAHGLSPAAAGAQLAGLVGEQDLTKLSLDGTQIDAVARYSGSNKYNSIAALQSAVMQTPTGPVQLGDIATIGTDSAAGTVQHQDGQRFATVKASLTDGANTFNTQNDVNDWAKSHLQAYGMRSDALQSKGEGDDIAQSFTNLFEALGVAILMIYLVLALFFNSFLKPIIITFALPLAFLGVFPTLALEHNEFGFLEILGLITLAGIVVNVGIFVIDYANHRVAEGMSVKEAIAQATAVRFRPIFLTKVVALGSLLPLAILSPFWRGLTSVIIAGILTSGVLSLFTTPILYTWFDKLSRLPAWIASRESVGKRDNSPL